jgi:hypothetical protein
MDAGPCGLAVDLGDHHEVHDLADHAPDLRPVLVLDGVADPVETEGA